SARLPGSARAWRAATAGSTAGAGASARDAARPAATTLASWRLVVDKPDAPDRPQRPARVRQREDGARRMWPGAHYLHPEMLAEVHAPDIGVVDDLRRRALRQHMAVADDVGMVADAQRLAHVVIGDQHADAALLEKTDDPLDLDHGDRVDARERLVQQDE